MTETWTFGSAEGCDVRITDDEYVSGRHAMVIRNQRGQVFVSDLGSTNGTFAVVGGYRVRVRAPVQLRPGDSIVIGRTTIPWTGK